MKVIKNDQTKEVHITISGECSIYDTLSFHKLLVEVLREKKPVRINLSEIKEMDTAVFQLLIALKKEHVTVTYHNHSPAILKLIDLYGLAGFFGDSIKIRRDERQNYSFTYGINRGRVNES